MKSLNSFLNPVRKENLKFILSDSFLDDKGNPIEWEMKQLTALEGIEIQKELNSTDYMEIMTGYVANALVYPCMRDKELLSEISKKECRNILDPVEALKTMLLDNELAKLISLYSDYNNVSTAFSKGVEEAKN